MNVQIYNRNVVFTTNSRLIARVLMLICKTVNITDTTDEYHCQASLLEFK